MDGELMAGMIKPKSAKKPGITRRWHVVAGWCLVNEYRKGAEIGVSTGRFTSYLCSIMPEMQMTAVDLWQYQPERDLIGAETYTDRPIEDLYRDFSRHCAEHFPGQVRILRKHSVEAADDVEDGSLDFVFIDADHTYPGCLADIKAWSPKVRRGGLICGHDFDWPGVLQAVTETGKVEFLAKDQVWGRIVR